MFPLICTRICVISMLHRALDQNHITFFSLFFAVGVGGGMGREKRPGPSSFFHMLILLYFLAGNRGVTVGVVCSSGPCW